MTENKKIAVIYKSHTGNTKLVADALAKAAGDSLVYCGEPKEGIDADLYLIGSWVDKGSCVSEISEFLSALKNRKLAFFATAGFGGSEEYYNKISDRMASVTDSSNEILGCFICQGKMPMAVRERYVKMITENPEDKSLEVSLKNFDEALKHPNEDDFENAKNWLAEITNGL